MPVIEANAIGRPVIVSNISPMKDVAGKAGCLVDPTDVADIRRGIQRVIDDEHYRTTLIALGYENARQYSATEIAARYCRIYSELELSGQRNTGS